MTHSSDASAATPSPSTPRASDPARKLILVGDHDGPISEHPALRGWLERDWRVMQATPRVIEGVGTKLLVVLRRAHAR